MLIEEVTDPIIQKHDQEATWRDAEQIQFRARPLSHDIIKLYSEDKLVKSPSCTRVGGIYVIGRDVLVRAKWLGIGGSSAEPAAMQVIRKEAPSVPVPEVLHHWRDESWFCHFTIMRYLPGSPISSIWYALAPVHQQRLAKEITDHIHTVAQIQPETSQYPKGVALYDRRVMDDPEFRPSYNE